MFFFIYGGVYDELNHIKNSCTFYMFCFIFVFFFKYFALTFFTDTTNGIIANTFSFILFNYIIIFPILLYTYIYIYIYIKSKAENT